MPRKEERSGSGPASAVTPTEPVGQRLSSTRHLRIFILPVPRNSLSQGRQAASYATKWPQIEAGRPCIHSGQRRAVQSSTVAAGVLAVPLREDIPGDLRT